MVVAVNVRAGNDGLPSAAGGGVPLSAALLIWTRNLICPLPPVASAALSVTQPENASLGVPLRTAVDELNARPGNVRLSE